MALIDVFKESTQQEILAELRSQQTILALMANKYSIDEILRLVGASRTSLDALVGAMIDGTNTTKLFKVWWPLAREQDEAQKTTAEQNRYATLCRWFTLLGNAWDGKIYTLRETWWENNTTGSPVLTPLDDLSGKTAAVCATEETADDFDWADEDPMTWYLRFNGLSLADGTMNVLAVEGVDDTFDISGNTAPVYTGRLGLWKQHYSDGEYEYRHYRTTEATGFRPWAADVAPDGTHRPMNWQATFGGSKTADGKLTSGSGFDGQSWSRNGNITAISMSVNAGLTAARLWDAYEGTFSDTDLAPIIDLFQLRHFNLENSGIIDGCLNYSLDYTVAMAEDSVTSVVVTVAQGNNFYVGSFLDIGTTARGGQIARGNLLRKEAVTIDGTDYIRLHLDLPTAVNIPEGAHVATLPWTPGSTEHLPGHKDGSMYSCTSGKAPARIAGVELIDGAYAIGLDPLWQSNYNADRDPKSIYTIYQVRSGEHQAGSITANHEESGTFTSNATGWQYEKHYEIRDDDMLAPDAVGGSSSTFLKSAFYFSASSGVCAPWRFCLLSSGGLGGLAGADGYSAPGSANWAGRPWLSGSGKTRGEWTA